MSDQFNRHKLTVIFYADVAGYSRLTAQDEQGTHQRVMAMLDYASDTITAAGGSVLRYAGDAILAEFPSTLKAVQSAIDIQTESEQRNTLLSGEDCLQPDLLGYDRFQVDLFFRRDYRIVDIPM
jgi:adenylate cyclase